jgi:hypothetical protein
VDRYKHVLSAYLVSNIGILDPLNAMAKLELTLQLIATTIRATYKAKINHKNFQATMKKKKGKSVYKQLGGQISASPPRQHVCNSKSVFLMLLKLS